MKRNAMLGLAVLCLVALAAENAAIVPQQTANLKPAVGDLTDAITIPKLLSYQGRLTDTLGVPVPDTTYQVAFRLYTVPSGGTPFWSETQTVRTKAGLFSVLLGSVNPIDTIPQTGNLYLGMAVGSGAELTPRLRLVSAAYSYCSDNAAKLDGNNITALDSRFVNEGQANSVTSGMIVDGTIVATDLNQMGATTGQVLKWTGSAWAPRNDSVGGGAADNAWVRGTQDSVLFTIRPLGVARGGVNNMLYGNYRWNHTNLGYACTTGTSGQDYQICVVCGGYRNTASGPAATIAGGERNSAGGIWATVAGGYSNLGGDGIADTGATVAGGYGNKVTGRYAFVGGGLEDTASGACATVCGGYRNAATLFGATVGGGNRNKARGYAATVAGGDTNIAWGNWATVAGGYNNLGGDATADTAATICGGSYNSATARHTFVGGGRGDTASAPFTTVGGGYHNIASGFGGTVGGGGNNTASSGHATVGGGQDNTAGGGYATVAGGSYNVASGYNATVGGGAYNTASGNYATVPGGTVNSARGSFSLAAGFRACANHNGSFVWSDSAPSAADSVYTTGANQFRVRARGGVWFFSNLGMTSGVTLAPGSNSWASACDSANKEDFRAVDRRALLERLASLRIREYKMKSQNDGTRHIGPVAQEFYSLFGFGESKTAINMADMDGVTLAAIQALYEQVKAQQVKIEAQQAEIEALKAELQRR